MNVLFLLAATNLTDWFIETLGWDFMQLLWGPLEFLFGFLNGLMPSPMWQTVWDTLFT